MGSDVQLEAGQWGECSGRECPRGIIRKGEIFWGNCPGKCPA